jgi:CBS domain-containing protein
MTAGDVMNRNFETVQADASLEDVIRKLESTGMQQLPVCQDGHLVGIVTQEDILTRAPLAGRRSNSVRVADVIAPDLVFCFVNTEVNEAANLMRENRVGLLPVLDQDKAVVGVLVLEDIPSDRKAKQRV